MENEPTPVVEPRLNTNKALLMNSLSMGLIIAGIFVLLSVMYYILDINMMSILSSILMFLVNLAVLITTITMVMKKFRDKINGGTTTYTKSLFSGWIAGFIGLAVSGIFSFLFFHFFAPEYWTEQVAKLGEMLSAQNLPQEKIDEVMAQVTARFEPIKQITGTAINSVVFSGILSLIIAAFIRKGEKMPETL
ncbi:MAG: DUF4199 domain-containing protein [Bacteroidota bacterium]